MSLTIYDQPDLELLTTVDNVGNGKGATTDSICAILNVERRNCSSRLSWMRQKDFVTRDINGAWYLTAKGKRLLKNPSQVQGIRQMARKVSTDESMRWIARREWQREMYPRK